MRPPVSSAIILSHAQVSAIKLSLACLLQVDACSDAWCFLVVGQVRVAEGWSQGHILNVPIGPASAREAGIEPIHQLVEPVPVFPVVIARQELQMLRVIQGPQQLPQPVTFDGHGAIVPRWTR
jgi:hypothetical protein